MVRKSRQREYENNERERRSPWNVVSFVLFVLLSFTAVLLTLDDKPSLRSGDLVFQTGGGDMSQAIGESTGGSFSHVGIIERCGDSLFVLEATPEKGVARTPFQEFADSSARDAAGRPEIAFYRVKNLSKALKDSAVARARGFLGRPYNISFMGGPDSLYCSELVWEAFLDGSGEHIFPRIPMNFKDEGDTVSRYWVEFYAALGREVPQGEPGTNPNDLSKSKRLKKIH